MYKAVMGDIMLTIMAICTISFVLFVVGYGIKTILDITKDKNHGNNSNNKCKCDVCKHRLSCPCSYSKTHSKQNKG